MNQTQCPNCNSFNTASISLRHLLRVIGAAMFVLGVATLIFLIGIPFIPLGAIVFIASFFVGESGKMRCKNCQFIFQK